MSTDIHSLIDRIIQQHPQLLGQLAQMSDPAQAARLVAQAAERAGHQLDVAALESYFVTQRNGAAAHISDAALQDVSGGARPGRYIS